MAEDSRRSTVISSIFAPSGSSESHRAPDRRALLRIGIIALFAAGLLVGTLATIGASTVLTTVFRPR